jgi:DNA-binding NarL/FixJ family response regulator
VPASAEPEEAEDQVSVLMVVEDDQDMRTLVHVMLSREPRLKLCGEATSAEAALELLDELDTTLGLVILDQGLDGAMTGLEAAPLIKEKAPEAKVLLFTAYDLRAEAAQEPAVDEFRRKDKIFVLVPTVRRLLGLDAA